MIWNKYSSVHVGSCAPADCVLQDPSGPLDCISVLIVTVHLIHIGAPLEVMSFIYLHLYSLSMHNNSYIPFPMTARERDWHELQPNMTSWVDALLVGVSNRHHTRYKVSNLPVTPPAITLRSVSYLRAALRNVPLPLSSIVTYHRLTTL